MSKEKWRNGLRFCKKCEDYLPPENFRISRTQKDGLGCYCRACLLQEECDPLRKANVSIKARRKRAEKKCSAIAHYGGACACCGQDTFDCLTIDHKLNNGAQHRKELKGKSIYHWLYENNYPPDFRVLCFKCNCSSGFQGKCPHGSSDYNTFGDYDYSHE